MQPEQEHQTQAEFARTMGVSRAAVSQWKARDILRDDAFTKPGKKGKLIVATARDQVRRNRDIGQALGNGIETNTTQPDPAPVSEQDPQPDLLAQEPANATGEPPAEKQLSPKPVSIQDKLAEAKLEAQRRKNRIEASDEALRQGLLMSADDAREQMTRVAGMMMQIFEGSLTDFAAVIASQFSVPQRDVLHALKNEFRNVRHTATKKEKERLAEVKKETTASIGLDA